MLAEVVTFNKEHEGGIKLLMPIHYSQKIPRIPLCKNLRILGISSANPRGMSINAHREDILERRLEEVSQLLLSDELKQGRLQWITSHITEELHVLVEERLRGKSWWVLPLLHETVEWAGSATITKPGQSTRDALCS